MAIEGGVRTLRVAARLPRQALFYLDFYSPTGEAGLVRPDFLYRDELPASYLLQKCIIG